METAQNYTCEKHGDIGEGFTIEVRLGDEVRMFALCQLCFADYIAKVVGNWPKVTPVESLRLEEKNEE